MAPLRPLVQGRGQISLLLATFGCMVTFPALPMLMLFPRSYDPCVPRYADINDKMDQIAVPSVLQDAMENQGLLTYDPSFLLVTDAAAPTPAQLRQQQFVALVTAHEISHQWFGDTVTNEYWNSEYLHEGFARYWQYVAVAAFFPEYDIWNGIFGGDFDIGFYGFTYNRGLDADYSGTMVAPVVSGLVVARCTVLCRPQCTTRAASSCGTLAYFSPV